MSAVLALTASLLVKLAALCLAFAHYAEARFTDWLDRHDTLEGSIVSVAGVAFVIDAIAEVLGSRWPSARC